ncbi:MAG: hypothetical protein HQL28_01770 [Candidatus Omnitrophica bacterium]|nr:hypothetical protein [Candidatus Omnitrophota bacterium]
MTIKRSFTKSALKEIRSIHALSKRYNKTLNKNHTKALMHLVKEHADEIEELSEKKDKHFVTETGDLAILCFEIIMENKASIDAVIGKCYKRYMKKLTQLISEEEGKT